MAKYIVLGDNSQYDMEAPTIMEAWEYAEKELKFGLSGNTKIVEIMRK